MDFDEIHVILGWNRVVGVGSGGGVLLTFGFWGQRDGIEIWKVWVWRFKRCGFRKATPPRSPLQMFLRH